MPEIPNPLNPEAFERRYHSPPEGSVAAKELARIQAIARAEAAQPKPDPKAEDAKDGKVLVEALVARIPAGEKMDRGLLAIRALELRRKRRSHQEIADELGISVTRASGLITSALEKIGAASRSEAEHVRTIELLRLDDMERSLMEIYEDSDAEQKLKTMDRLLAIMQFRSRILGLVTSITKNAGAAQGGNTFNFVSVQAGILGISGPGAGGANLQQLREQVQKALVSAAAKNEDAGPIIDVDASEVSAPEGEEEEG
jgi:hypothetical protein